MIFSKIIQKITNSATNISKAIIQNNSFNSKLLGISLFGIFVALFAFTPLQVFAQGLSDLNFSRFTSFVQIIDALRIFLQALAAPLAILIIVWGGYQYYFGGIDGKQDGLRAVLAGITGLVIVIVANAVIPVVQRTIGGDATFNPDALREIFVALADGLITLSLVVSIFVIIWGGYKFFQGGFDEKSDGKQAVQFGVIGLVFTLTARAIVALFEVIRDRPLTEVPGLLFNSDGTIYPVIQAIGVALIVLSLVASILVIVWGGYQYFRGGIDGKTEGLQNVQNGVVGLVFVLLATFIGTALFGALQNGTSTEFGTIVNGVRDLIQLVVENLTNALIFVSGIIAVFVIVWGGYQYFFGGLGAKTEGKQNVINGVVGLLFVLFAYAIGVIVTNVFTTSPAGQDTKGIDPNSIFKSGADFAKLPQNALDYFLPALDSIINLLIFVASVIAVLVLVWGGYQYFFAAEVDLGGGKSKKQDGKDAIRSGFIGLVVCVIARPLVEIVDGTIGVEFVQNNPQLNLKPDNIVFLVQAILANLLIPISSAVAIFFFILAAYYWFTSNGDADKVKKAKEAILNAIIGFVVVLLAATIVQIIILLIQTTQINADTPPTQEPDNSNIQVIPGNPFGNGGNGR